MKKVIVILGNEGMVGHMIQKYLEHTDKYIVVGLNRKHFDLLDYITLDQKLIVFNPDIVINCVGLLNKGGHLIQDYADVNVVLPRILNYLSKQDGHKFKVIHLSTNCVFKDIGPHKKGEFPTATDTYGISKYLGEIINGTNLTIRTSVIGPELKKDGIGLWNQVITGNITKVYKNVFWNGVTTLELAKYIDENMDEVGLKHIHSNIISKADLCDLIVEKELNKTISNNAHQSLLVGDKRELTIQEQITELKEFIK